jgi:hypothetical protein
MWSHAEALLQGDPSDFKRTDALTTLKRAIDRRVRQLNTFHDFKSIPIPGKPNATLELLEYVGLIRPIMLQRLIEIRNAVEHEDALPPTVEELLIFLEFVWYFLRSTDSALRHRITSFHLQPVPLDEASPYSFSVQLGPDTGWIPKIHGWVEPDMISIEKKQRWLTLNITKTTTRQEFFARQEPDPFMEIMLKDYGIPDTRGKNPNDIFLIGEMRSPMEAIIQLIRVSLRLI